MTWSLEFTRKAQKQLEGLSAKDRVRVVSKLEKLALDSPDCDVRKLRGELNTYRLRVGSFRILFEKDGAVLKILVFQIVRRTSTPR